uniref:ABC transporter permease n=1 Tax=Agathobacter sp. TaxID=2021311 RepID=UPI0040569008
MKKRISRRVVKENIQLGTLILPAIVLIAMFSYFPMFGIILAFKNYTVTKGIFGSDWANPLFDNFEFFLKSQDAFRVVRNTILLNLLFIFAGTLCAVVFGLLLYEVKKAYQVKLYQTFAILPSFLSWVAVSYIVYGLLDTEKGVINQLIRLFGGENVSWYTSPNYWPVILLLVRVWHSVGLNCIMYYASLMGIDNELFEAADMDGANKIQKMLHISIPHLVPLVTLLVILDIGGIFRADFGLFYNVTRNVGNLYPTTDVIDTYIFRALMEQGNIGMSSAAALIQSVVCTITLVTANAVARKVSPGNSLF